MAAAAFVVRPPRTPEEAAAGRDLRWRVLRAPWGRPRGSELDAHEAGALHLLAVAPASGAVIGAGRAHFNSPAEAQLRGMAVEEAWPGRGVGAAILRGLESRAAAAGGRRIVLSARDLAVPFYQRHGYRVERPGELLFGVIPHSWMAKEVALAGAWDGSRREG
ncbi:MAG TPA: GNAT family N-acetyltransferase [Verrucomicrobiota bacterium]|nr:GNAT family N-acetyltransferase [Verrucomicrobiota bacterium]